MANSKPTSPAHVPGPWVLRPNGEIKAEAWIGKWDDYICKMPFSSLEEASELSVRQLPNARLIAAAPELLEACEVGCAVLQELSHHPGFRQSSYALVEGKDAIDRLEAAITKAKNKQA